MARALSIIWNAAEEAVAVLIARKDAEIKANLLLTWRDMDDELASKLVEATPDTKVLKAAMTTGVDNPETSSDIDPE